MSVNDKINMVDLKLNRFITILKDSIFSGNGTPTYKGIFNQLLNNDYLHRKENHNRLDSECFEKWSQCEHHGFIHGLMTTFMCLWISGKLDNDLKRNEIINNKEIIQIIYDCLFHDFYRCKNDIFENHDKDLSLIFKSCSNHIYRHSSPISEDEDEWMINADRLELLRFSDWKEWVDLSKVQRLMKTLEDFEYIDFFYKHFRNKIDTLWKYKDRGWVHHHVEDLETWDFPIDVYPDKSCLSFYKNDLWSVNHCRLYDINFSEIFSGILPIDKCVSEVVYDDAFPREHLILSHRRKNNVTDWIFIVDNKEKSDKKKHDVQTMVNNGHIPFQRKTIQKLINIFELLFDRIYLSSVCRE